MYRKTSILGTRNFWWRKQPNKSLTHHCCCKSSGPSSWSWTYAVERHSFDGDWIHCRFFCSGQSGGVKKNGHIRIPSLKLTTNAPQNRPGPPKKGGSSSNHPFFRGELLVLGSVFSPGSPWPTFYIAWFRNHHFCIVIIDHDYHRKTNWKKVGLTVHPSRTTRPQKESTLPTIEFAGASGYFFGVTVSALILQSYFLYDWTKKYSVCIISKIIYTLECYIYIYIYYTYIWK